jgi:hypothetical protein
MNVGEVRNLIGARANVVTHARVELAEFANVIVNRDVAEYLTECLPDSSYLASSVNVLDLREIRDYVAEGCSPGGFILPFGYVVVAVDVGGNAICFGADGQVYWADHSAFTSTITYHNLERDEWEDWGNYTTEKVKKALILLGDNIEAFLKEFLADRLSQRIEALG